MLYSPAGLLYQAAVVTTQDMALEIPTEARQDDAFERFSCFHSPLQSKLRASRIAGFPTPGSRESA
jgi:hypothetical protein